MGSGHELAIRRPDVCDACGTSLDAGVRAWWDAKKRVVRCLSCHKTRGTTEKEPQMSVRFEDVDRGRPGRSALAEHHRLHPQKPLSPFQPPSRIVTVLGALIGRAKPPSTWAQGEEGEVRVGTRLEDLVGDAAVLLHDRSVPGSRANIDHLAVAPSGVWIIDAKHYSGKLEVRNNNHGGGRLFVNGWDHSEDIEGFEWQERAVTDCLRGLPVPIHRALCFVEVEWPLFSKPYQLNGVWIIWAKELAKKIAAPGPLGQNDVQRITVQLATALPVKT
jgi:hypothetical protein